MRSVRVLAAGFAVVLVCAGGAQAATPELSTNSRLQDRREVAAGQRSYVEGFQDGRFYANGWHSTGEMGGVWAPPLKLVDGVWFGIDDQWVGQATTFSSGWGYTRYDLPDAGGLHVAAHRRRPRRRPRRALRPAADAIRRAADKTVTVKVDAHSELMGAYPWGFTGVTPNASDNLPDHGAYTAGALQFTDDGALPGRARAPLRGARRRQPGPGVRRGRATGGALRGPQPGTVCTGTERPTPPPSACDDGPFGKGTGGELRYEVTVPAGGSKTLWVAVAGSDKGLADAQSQLAGALQDPARRARGQDRLARQAVEVVAGVAARRPAAAERDRLGQAEPRRRHADRLGPPDPLDQPGQAVPAAARDGRPRPLVRRRLSPTTRGSSPPTASTPNFAAVALGQFETAKDHLRTLRDISDVLNNRSGIVVARGGVRRIDLVRPRLADDRGRRYEDQRLQHRRDDQVPERGRARSGAGPATTASATRCTTSPSATCRSSTSASTSTTTAGPRARATSSARAWAPRSSTTASTTSASLYDLADMARSKHDGAPFAWATNLGAQAPEAVRGHVVGHRRTAVRRLADRPGQRRSPSRSTGSARCRWRPS